MLDEAQRVSTRSRWWLVAPLILGTAGIWAGFVDNPRRRPLHPVLDTLTSVFPWPFWGVLSVAMAVAAVVGIVTGLWWAYAWANWLGWVFSFSMLYSAVWAGIVRPVPRVSGFTVGWTAFLAFTFLFVLVDPVKVHRRRD